MQVRLSVGLAAIAACACALLFLHMLNINKERAAAKAHFIELHAKNASAQAKKLEQAFTTIYTNIRTISNLPAVIGIDRHATNLTGDGRKSIQQIYNNLASQLAISEVYVLPVDFDPERIDPKTGKGEEPIIMFDELIINAGKFAKSEDPFKAATDSNAQLTTQGELEEVEIEEYRQLKKQLLWLKANYGDISKVKGLNVPMIAGREVITCDNTTFAHTRNDADRTGVMFSVPIYDAAGKLKGAVTAIILSNALKALMPPKNFALINGPYGFVSRPSKTGQEARSAKWLKRSEADPNLIYSQVIDIKSPDPRSLWRLWAGMPNAAFYASADARRVDKLEFGGYSAIVVLTLAAFLSWWLYCRNVDLARKRQASAEHTADEIRIAHEKALESQRETAKMADQLQKVNDDVVNLNKELAANVKELTEVQDKIVRQGKLAQLGELTATIAHEIRNPLGSVRTSAFLIGRKFAEDHPKIQKPLDRIENGIKRCDNIISELLAFARGGEIERTEVKFDEWLVHLVREQAKMLPKQVALECRLGLGEREVSFDPDKLSRAVINFLTNASEAMVGKGSVKPENPTANPKIVLTTSLGVRGVELSVSDNGPGMSPETREKIFTPLFTTKSFGVGLGLPAVEKIFEQHGGGLDVDSKEGEGATFTGWFPLQEADRQAA